MSKDKVAALAAYFEEVHAEQCPGCQHNILKSRSSSFASKSDSKESSSSSSSDDDDTYRTCNTAHSRADEFQTIRHQRSAAEAAEETDGCATQVREPDAEKPSVQESSKPEVRSPKYLRHGETDGGFPESETATSRYDRPSRNVDPDQTQDVAPVDLQTDVAVPHDKSERTNDETFLPRSAPGATLHRFELPGGETEIAEQDVGTSSARTPEATSVATMVISGCPVEEQTQCKSLPSIVDGASPLQVNYVRTRSLKSFWDVVTPPPSPKLQKQEGKSFPDAESHEVQVRDHNHFGEDNVKTDRPNETQGQAQPEGHRDNPLENEITPTQTEDLIQHFLQFLAPGANQQSSENSCTNETHNLRNDRHRDSDVQEDDSHEIPNNSRQNNFNDRSANYSYDDTDVLCNKTSRDRPGRELTKLGFLSECEFPDDDRQQLLQTSRRLPTESPPKGVSSEVSEFECLLGRIHSNLPTPPRPPKSGNGDERNGTTQPGTLTEKDIRKYQLGCHDDRRDAEAGEDRLWSPMYNRMQSPMEMDSFENPSQRGGLSSKPPLPPRRFHVTRYYVRDSSDPDQEIPDYEELEDDDAYNCHSPEKSLYGTEFSADDNHRNSVLDSKRYVFHYPKSDIHIPGSPSAAPTGFQFAFQRKEPVQFRNYSKSWDNGKRNSYPAAKFRSYSQPEEEWDNVASTDSAWHYPVDFDKNVRPLSAYQVLDGSNRDFKAEVPLRSNLANRQRSSGEEDQKNSKDAENDLVFYEITKQIETLKQTVSELQNKKTDGNSRF